MKRDLQASANLRDAALGYGKRGWPVLPLFGVKGGQCACGRDCNNPGKHPRTAHGVKDATTDIGQIEGLWNHWPNSNVGIRTGRCSGLVVLDVDGKRGRRSLKELKNDLGSRWLRTRRSRTGKGNHYLFQCSEPVYSSVGKLGPGIDIRGENGYFTAPPSRHISGVQYEWIDADAPIAAFPKKLIDKLKTAPLSLRPEQTRKADSIPVGERNTTLARFAGVMRRPGMSAEAIQAALRVENRERCSPPLPEQEVRKIADSCARYQPTAPGLKVEDAALYGLPGEIVRILEPHSEADPAALLLQVLVMIGNVIGPGPHFIVEADRHGFNLFTNIVGDSSKARKGTSTGQVGGVIKRADALWVEQHVQTGLSSGEGLIHALCERREGLPTKLDKRLLILEPEFSSTLKVLARKGNTLSPVLRQAWDGGTLAVMTRKSPLRATGVHVSLIGHITQDELRAELQHAEVFGGFANRFLWVKATRSKVLPFGGGLSVSDVDQLAAKVKRALAWARRTGRIELSQKAARLWASVYPQLSEGEPGLLGAVTSRAEAQVRRLAGIYALMDYSRSVKARHLEAALAMWRYCHSSAHLIFAGRQASTLPDRILGFLHAQPAGLTRTEVSQRLANHFPASSIEAALNTLVANDLVRQITERTPGRSAIRFLAVGGEAGKQKLLAAPESKIRSGEGE